MREKIRVVALGILFALLSLECGLRIAGLFATYRRAAVPTPVAAGRENIKILCLGNSFTAGDPAPGNNYPEHLEGMLNSYYRKKHFVVINKGLVNANTSEIVAALPSYIEKYAPDCIVLTAGTPNLWNRYKYTDYLQRKKEAGSCNSTRNQIFHEVRILRFAQLLFSKLVRDYNSGRVVKEYGQDDDDIVMSEKYHEVDQWIQGNWREKGLKTLISDRDKAADAEKTLREAIASMPKYARSYALLSQLFMLQKKYPQAVRCCIDGIEASPDFRDYEENRCYCYLRLMKRVVLDKEVQKMIADYYNRNKGLNNSNVSFNLEELSYFQINEWVTDDINTMADIIATSGIKLVLHNYPPRRGSTSQHTKTVNSILREIAYDREIFFVDIETLFQQMWDKGANPEEYHSMYGSFMDFHLNKKGYILMAYYIFDAIRRADFLGIEKNRPMHKANSFSLPHT